MCVFVFRKYLPRKIRNQILPDSYAKNPFKLFEEKCIILKTYYLVLRKLQHIFDSYFQMMVTYVKDSK